MNLDDFIDLALREDMPQGDITTDPLNLKKNFTDAFLIAKQDLTLSGSELFEKTFKKFDSNTQIDWKFKDGQHILKKQIVAHISGAPSDLLKAERTALNFLGYLSGIASYTKKFVDACSPSKTKILHTRKILPFYRQYVQKAVIDGGGSAHRKNLSEFVMIKDNHISLAGGIESAVKKIREKNQSGFIEVEVKNIDEVKVCTNLNINRIMFDNMSNEDIEKSLKYVPSHIETEASGNMNLERISQIKSLGLDYISIGAITHSAPQADFTLLMEI